MEQELVFYVNYLIQNKEHISTNIVSYMAINLNYDFRNLTSKDTNHYFSNKGIQSNPESDKYQ